MNMPSLDLLFPAHIAELRSRTDRALAAAGFDGVVFQSGEPLGLARDDQHYPYTAHPHFKWWAPLADAAAGLYCFDHEPHFQCAVQATATARAARAMATAQN